MSLPSDHRMIDDQVAVSGQITVEQVNEIAQSGYKSLICNRPDGEAPDQTEVARIEQAAKAAGLAFRNIPVLSSGMTMENVEATRTALDELERPILAYCRSGARSTNVYNMAKARS